MKQLEIYGLSFKYIISRLFLDKNFYGHIYKDSNNLEEVLHYRNDSLANQRYVLPEYKNIYYEISACPLFLDRLKDKE